LLSVDPLSGRVRQDLLNDAIAHSDAARVISFFRGFMKQQRAAEQAPARGRPAASGSAAASSKPFYTHAQIRSLYEQHRRGAHAGRQVECARQEQDIFDAQREGRVQFMPFLTK